MQTSSGLADLSHYWIVGDLCLRSCRRSEAPKSECRLFSAPDPKLIFRKVPNPYIRLLSTQRGGNPELAISLTGEALAGNTKSETKIKSALATTRGAALRAVGRRSEAKALGEEAHALEPNDYRPCTLLGAVHIELGDLNAGHEWFVNAEQRGATKAALDHDIKALLARLPKAERARVRRLLLDRDPEQFAWLQ